MDGLWDMEMEINKKEEGDGFEIAWMMMMHGEIILDMEDGVEEKALI